MKKILSLVLIICLTLTVLILPSCKKDKGNGDGGTTEPSAPLPSTYAELINISSEKTMASFFGENKTEHFSFDNGIKANIAFDLEALAGLKLDADIVGVDSFFKLDVKTLKFHGENLDGIRLVLSDKEIALGADALLSKNYGFKFTEAKEQIAGLVKKIIPNTSYNDILNEVGRYLNEFEEALGGASQKAPELTDTMISEIEKLFADLQKGEFSIQGTDVAVKSSFTLGDILNAVEESILVLKDDDEWRAYLTELDASLKKTLFADASIPSNATSLDYIITMLEDALADENLTVDAIAIKSETVVGLDMLLKSGTITLFIGNESAFSLTFNANYEGNATFLASLKQHKNATIDIAEEKELLEVKLEKTSKSATENGFKITLTDKNPSTEATSEDMLAYSAFVFEYSKDSGSNEYEISLLGMPIGSNEFTSVFSLEGKWYQNKDEFFFSIDKLGIDAMGVSFMINFKLKITAPTADDLKMPAYTNIKDITSADLNKAINFYNSVFGEQGESDTDTTPIQNPFAFAAK